MSSVGVKGDVFVAGDTVFGEQDSDSFLEIHSLVEGRFPLSLAEASNPAASVTLNLPDPTGDSFIHLPDASGTIVTTGSLPAVMDNMVVVGSATLEGKVRMEGDVVIGDKLKPGLLEVCCSKLPERRSSRARGQTRAQTHTQTEKRHAGPL